MGNLVSAACQEHPDILEPLDTQDSAEPLASVEKDSLDHRGQVAHPVSLEEVNIMVVPGLAFDKSGHRLGHGGGYYDRLLPRVKGTVPIIALSYEEQIFVTLPSEPHDIGMDMIITPERTIDCGG